MSDTILNSRQLSILLYALSGRSYSLSEFGATLSKDVKIPSPATLRRDISALCELGFFIQSGSKKTTKYYLNSKKLPLAPIDAATYCSIDVDERPGNRDFNSELFPNFPDALFEEDELNRLKLATTKFNQSSAGASQAIIKKELERFVIELSWKSSKIEGNTYTLLDTELLIKEGIEAKGRSREEAIMILNHKKAFDYILEIQTEFRTLSVNHIKEIHRLLVSDLDIPFGFRNRVIGITGSIYRPMQIQSQLQESAEELLVAINRSQNPFSKALTALAAISYLQPFEDGNKRTSRLTANAILLTNQCAPLSYRSISEVSYREAMLTFYEKNSLTSLKALFIEQYLFSCENYLKFTSNL